MDFIAFHGPWIGQYHLIFNEQLLKDGNKFSDYKIQEGTIIRFRCQTFFLIVIPATRNQYGGMEPIRLEVTGSETIGNLKDRLWDGGLIPRSKKTQSRLRL